MSGTRKPNTAGKAALPLIGWFGGLSANGKRPFGEVNTLPYIFRGKKMTYDKKRKKITDDKKRKKITEFTKQGQSYFKKLEFDTAISCFSRAIKIYEEDILECPEIIDAYIDGAYALCYNDSKDMKHYDQAIDNLSTAIQLLDADKDPKTKAKAVADAKAVAKAAADADAAAKAAVAAAADADAAAKAAVAAKEAAKTVAEAKAKAYAYRAYAYQAYAYYLRGNYDRAISGCNKALELLSSSVFARELLASLYYNTKDYHKVIENYKDAVNQSIDSFSLTEKYKEACKKLNSN